MILCLIIPWFWLAVFQIFEKNLEKGFPCQPKLWNGTLSKKGWFYTLPETARKTNISKAKNHLRSIFFKSSSTGRWCSYMTESTHKVALGTGSGVFCRVAARLCMTEVRVSLALLFWSSAAPLFPLGGNSLLCIPSSPWPLRRPPLSCLSITPTSSTASWIVVSSSIWPAHVPAISQLSTLQ